MSTKGNKELVRCKYGEANQIAGDVSKLRSVGEKYYAPSYICHRVGSGDMNWEQTSQYLVAMMSAFPDTNASIDDMVAEDDKVAVRYTMKGTNRGAYMGIPATGKQIAMKAVEILRLDKGKL